MVSVCVVRARACVCVCVCARAQTHSHTRTRSVRRGELLRVTYPEDSLPRERLLLAVVADGSSRLMLKASVPLAPLVPGAGGAVGRGRRGRAVGGGGGRPWMHMVLVHQHHNH